MISYPDLGHYGRLGNRLFQMGAAIELAMEHDESYGFPRWGYEGCFEIGALFHDTLPDGPEYREKQFPSSRVRVGGHDKHSGEIGPGVSVLLGCVFRSCDVSYDQQLVQQPQSYPTRNTGTSPRISPCPLPARSSSRRPIRPKRH